MGRTADISALLTLAHPGRHRVKWIERLLDCSRRTAQRIAAGVGEPSASELLHMARQSDELRAELLRLLGDYNDAENPRAGGSGPVAARAVAGAARAVARLADAVKP